MIAPRSRRFHANGRETYGDSMIVDHWGRILGRLPRGRGCVSADIDLIRQAEARRASCFSAPRVVRDYILDSLAGVSTVSGRTLIANRSR